MFDSTGLIELNIAVLTPDYPFILFMNQMEAIPSDLKLLTSTLVANKGGIGL
jgi:hypothetical protein